MPRRSAAMCSWSHLRYGVGNDPRPDVIIAGGWAAGGTVGVVGCQIEQNGHFPRAHGLHPEVSTSTR